jgi:hypothetical protein
VVSADAKKLWAEAGENVARLRACKRHRFDTEKVVPFQRMFCLECGGELGLRNVGDYIRGYAAAGGNSADIWPEWNP